MQTLGVNRDRLISGFEPLPKSQKPSIMIENLEQGKLYWIFNGSIIASYVGRINGKYRFRGLSSGNLMSAEEALPLSEEEISLISKSLSGKYRLLPKSQ